MYCNYLNVFTPNTTNQNKKILLVGSEDIYIQYIQERKKEIEDTICIYILVRSKRLKLSTIQNVLYAIRYHVSRHAILQWF